MLNLKFQYFGHLMRRTDSFEKTPLLAKIEGRRRRGRQRMRWLDGITDLMDMSLNKLCSPWGHKESDMTERLNWTELNWKLNIQKAKIMASSPITSCQIDGETLETVTDFICLGSKITVDSDCSHEIKRHLLLRRKAMRNLGSTLKSRGITLPTKSV